MIRILAADALREAGWDVLSAPDGPAALALQPNRCPSLLIADVALPSGLNGRQVAAAARDRWPGLPVLFMTGQAEHLMAGGTLKAGMAVIAKPFHLSELVKRAGAMALGGTGS